MDPWGTPHRRFPGSEKISLIWTLNFLFDRSDLNYLVISSENPINSILFIKMSWFTVSKAFCKSIKIILVERPDSKPVAICC